jgi:hypothetical protein
MSVGSVHPSALPFRPPLSECGAQDFNARAWAHDRHLQYGDIITPCIADSAGAQDFATMNMEEIVARALQSAAGIGFTLPEPQAPTERFPSRRSACASRLARCCSSPEAGIANDLVSRIPVRSPFLPAQPSADSRLHSPRGMRMEPALLGSYFSTGARRRGGTSAVGFATPFVGPCWGGRPPTASVCQNEVCRGSQTREAARGQDYPNWYGHV